MSTPSYSGVPDRNLSLGLVVALGVAQCLLYLFYLSLRSFDLDGDGMRSLLLTLRWHDPENLTNSWYQYRYWPSETLLDVVVLLASKLRLTLDFLRTTAFFVANLTLFGCTLVVARVAGRRVAVGFAVLLWTVPVMWALASYTQGMTTANFWLSSASSTLFFAFLVSEKPLYLYLMAFVAALDLLHIYPAPILLYVADAAALVLLLAFVPRLRRPLVRPLLKALGIFVLTYVLAALLAGYAVTTDPLAYFKLLPHFLDFYFNTRAQETAHAFGSDHLWTELNFLLFSGPHVLPPNDECEMPMFVPKLWIIPGFLLLWSLLTLVPTILKTRRVPRHALLLVPLLVFLVLLKGTITAQRHYMVVVVPTLLFAATSLAAPFGRGGARALWLRAANALVVAGTLALTVYTVQSVKAEPFGVIDPRVVYGRWTGSSHLLNDIETYVIDKPVPAFDVVLFDTFRGDPRLLAVEHTIGPLPLAKVTSMQQITQAQWSAATLSSMHSPTGLFLVPTPIAAQITADLVASGYHVDLRLEQFNKVAIFASR